jgi:hypothetical protein
MTFGEQWGFELGPTERGPITGSALVCLLPGHCPSCGGKLSETTTWQPALFVACDYGQATATTIKRCHGCGWWIATGQETVNPRVFR